MIADHCSAPPRRSTTKSQQIRLSLLRVASWCAKRLKQHGWSSGDLSIPAKQSRIRVKLRVHRLVFRHPSYEPINSQTSGIHRLLPKDEGENHSKRSESLRHIPDHCLSSGICLCLAFGESDFESFTIVGHAGQASQRISESLVMIAKFRKSSQIEVKRSDSLNIAEHDGQATLTGD